MPTADLFIHLSNEIRKTRLNEIRNKIKKLLETEILSHFTDHGLAHSDRVVDNVNSLIEPIQGTPKRLSDTELFVLYASCYCHDFGMHWEKGRNISELREKHGLFSAELVRKSVWAEHPPLGTQLTEDDKPDLISALCEAHTCTTPDAYRLLTQPGPNIRMDLLAALLCVADILDESRRRAAPEKARALELEQASEVHWWRHYYVEDVTFEDWKIILCFDFPPSHHDEYARVVPELTLRPLKEELERHAEVFARAGLAWILDSKAPSKQWGAALKMPDAVLVEMQAELWARQQAEMTLTRIALAGKYEDAQPALNRILDEVESRKDSSSPADQVASLVDVADKLRKLGGESGELHVLRRAYETSKKASNARQQFEVGLRLANLLLHRDPKRAYNVVSELRQIMPAANVDQRTELQLNVCASRALRSIYRYEEAVSSYKHAIELSAALEQKATTDTLKIELAEFHLLAGELEDARRCADQVEDRRTDDVGHLSEHGRAIIVKAICCGIMEGLEEGVLLLNTEIEKATQKSAICDIVRLSVTRAYLLYIYGNLEEALNTLDECLLKADLTKYPSLHLLVRENQLMCQAAMLHRYNDSSFYVLRDLKKLLSV